MYNLLISIIIGVAAFLGAGYGLGGGDLNVLYGIVPGVLALVVAYLLLARQTFKSVDAIASKSQAAAESRDINRAIEILETARPYGKWQFFVDSQLDGQIGYFYFIVKDFKKAEPYLKKGYSKNWVAKTQLGVLYFKHRDYDKMVEAFEDAVSSNKKQPLLWNVYAYCQWDRGLKDDAISILNRCLKEVDDDEKTKANLLNLQNNRRMKMRGWDNSWYQFHLDRPPAPSIDFNPQRKNMFRG